MRPIRIRCPRLFMRQPIIVLLACLVGEMLQAIPLRARLRVDVHFIVHGAELAKVSKINLLLCELFSVEAGELDVVKRPVELDALACCDLAGGGEHDGWGEEVDSLL